MTRYKIGDVARLLGLTTQALRFYEQEGVIVPQKSENGTRYFTVAEIVRLLSFKKYRLSEFTVQDVSAHFKQGSLDSLILQLGEQSDALIEQSEILLKRARAIRSFERILREAKMQCDLPVCETTPDFYLYAPSFDRLNALNKREHEAFSAFSGAMPDTSMCFTCPTDLSAPSEIRFAATRHAAETWALPMDNVIHLPPFRCVRIHVRVPGHPWNEEYLIRMLDQVRAQGYEIDPDRPILGMHLASETIEKVIYLFGTLFIPIL